MRDIADNLIFAVNGKSKERFKMALELAMNGEEAVGYRIDPKMGLILYWHIDTNMDLKVNAFIKKSSPEELVEQLYSWVMSDDVRNVVRLPSDSVKNDNKFILNWVGKAGGVDNVKGWVIYKNSWGCVDVGWDNLNNIDDATLCAIAPSWLWLGK